MAALTRNRIALMVALGMTLAACGTSAATETPTGEPSVATVTTAPAATTSVVTSSPTTTTSTSTTTTAPPPTTTVAAVAAPAGFDSAPLTYSEMIDRYAATTETNVDGFRRFAMLTDVGYSAFQIDVPTEFEHWLLTLPADPVAAIAEGQDEVWGSAFRDSLEAANAVALDGEAVHRAAFIDPNSDALNVVSITLSPSVGLGVEELESVLVDAFSTTSEIMAMETFPVTGGVAVEITLRFDNSVGGWVEPLIEQKSFVLDEANEHLWAITCNLAESIADQFADTCTAITRSFVPWGPIVPDA